MKKHNSYTDVLDLSKDLLIYTFNRTKPIVNEINAGKVRKAFNDIAHIDDPNQIKDACIQAAHSIPSTDRKMGFSKSAYRDFGQDMRALAKSINTNVRRANNVNFKENPEERFRIIREALNDIDDLKKDIILCLEANIISPSVAHEWTGKVKTLERAIHVWINSCKALQERNEAEKNQNSINPYQKNSSYPNRNNYGVNYISKNNRGF